MNFYAVCGFLSYLPATMGTSFHWPKGGMVFDFIVAITVDGQPVSVGAMITRYVIVTSANPLEAYLKRKTTKDTEYYDAENKIKVYGVYQFINYALKVAGYGANLSKRKRVWVRMGFDRIHSPIHDLILITLSQKQHNAMYHYESHTIYDRYTHLFIDDWTFAGFGFVDKEHIANGTVLETQTVEESEEVDCDEWIPRAWGRFVCLLNVADVLAVQSGAPLFHNGTLRGVGSFSLAKGKETILVFTDVSPYRAFLDDYQYRTSTTTTTTPKPYNAKFSSSSNG